MAVPPEVEAALLLPDRLIGKYVRVSVLGSGGMGEVWKAWHLDLGRWVALKFIKSTDRDEVARFQREGLTAAKLNHPNIASIYEVGETAGSPYLAMQFVEGDLLSAQPGNDLRLLAKLLRDTAEAVHYAHQHGVVHRDVKPENVMVDKTGRVYVMDFGLAKQIEAGSSVSIPGTIVGTPAYMSPEQARGRAREIDPRSDVYSLGATLYRLLAGQPPFIGLGAYDIIRRVVDEEAAPVRSLNAHVDRDLDTIVMKCLEKDPTRRYGTAHELAEDLDRWLAGEPILAHPPSLVYRAVKYAARRKIPIAAISFALVVIAAAAGWMWKLRSEAQGWEREAVVQAGSGHWEEAKRLLDQAKGRISVDEALYARCERELAAQRALADAKRREDETFGPIAERIRALPDRPEGWRRAMQLLDEGLDRFPDSWDAWMRKAEYLEKLGHPADALMAYGRALALNPRLGTAHYKRGKLLMDVFDRDDEAQREFEAAQAEPGGNEYAAVAEARMAVLKNEMDRALKILAAAEPTARHVGELYYIRGYIRSVRSSSEYDAKVAMDDLNRAIDMEPTAVAYMNRGALKVIVGDWQGAVNDLTRALKLAPLVEGYFNRGAAHERLGDPEAAIEDFTEVVRLKPAYAEALAMRGRVRASMGHMQAGLKDCNAAIALQGDCVAARVIRADLLRTDRQYSAAIADYTAAIVIQPNLPEAFVNRANARIGTEDFEGAMRDMTKAIALRPTMPEAYAGRAESAMYLALARPKEKKGLLESAERDVMKALEVGGLEWPQRGRATEFLKAIRERLGKEAE